MNNESEIGQIFLSHEINDEDIRNLARELSKELQRRGYNVWSEKYILPGENWKKRIEIALKESDAMVALLDQYSFSSSYVRNEIEHALFDDKYKNRLLPVLIRASNKEDFSNLPWFLKKLNYLEISRMQSANKSARKIADHFQKMISRKENDNA